MDVQLFDTTLRDGTQSEGLSLSVEDKLKIARLLDGFGIHFIEGGYPGSNPKDVEFFQRAKSLSLKHAKLTAFGMTRKAGGKADGDPVLRALIEAQTPVVCIVGKSWNLHVTEVLGTTLEENLAMIGDSVALLKAHGKEVVYDAEHFFDGFRADQAYALASIKAAADAGADWITHVRHQRRQPARRTIRDVVTAVKKAIPTKLGIHTHNDSDLAVANALAGVEAGCTQVQGTINGWGERCGNANLISIIPALQLKMERRCVPDENLAKLTELSRAVSEIANIRPRAHAPYVGRSAFAHKGGMHVAAVEKVTHSYEHVPPERVGNRRHIVVSELAGRGNVRMRSNELGVDVAGNERVLLERIKDAREPGLPVRGRRGIVRAAGPAQHARLQAAVRGAGCRGDLGAAARQLDVRRGDGQAARRRRGRSHRRRGRRAGARARRRVSQGAEPALSAGA